MSSSVIDDGYVYVFDCPHTCGVPFFESVVTLRLNTDYDVIVRVTQFGYNRVGTG